MSKISGFDLGDPNKPFQVFGSQLGGRDGAITISRPTANINRDKIPELARHLSAKMKEIRATIEQLEVMQEMMDVDEEIDAIILDKNFADDYKDKVKKLSELFEEVLRASQR